MEEITGRSRGYSVKSGFSLFGFVRWTRRLLDIDWCSAMSVVGADGAKSPGLSVLWEGYPGAASEKLRILPPSTRGNNVNNYQPKIKFVALLLFSYFLSSFPINFFDISSN